MNLIDSWRWFGDDDPITLEYIKMTGVKNIVSGLHEIPIGSIWEFDTIMNHKNKIEKYNLKWSVVESIPVHESIKYGGNERDLYINNYIESIKNISKAGINILCYNFMPIVDWTRTQLDYKLPTDGLALRFNFLQMIIFEKFILKLKDIDNRYSVDQVNKAKKLYKIMKTKDIQNLKIAVMGGLPAAEKKYSVDSFKKMLQAYKNVKDKDLKENLKDFLREIIPIAEDHNVKMALHPDDPPIRLFGVPRVVSNLDDYKYILESYESPSNGMTFCAGSLASNKKNNVYKIFNKFKEKINFIHLRNIKMEKDNKSFYESNHLSGDINFVEIIKMIIKEEKRRSINKNKKVNIPMRPDHGHCLLDDQNKKSINPGYTTIGRMMGLSELRGIIKAIK